MKEVKLAAFEEFEDEANLLLEERGTLLLCWELKIAAVAFGSFAMTSGG